MASLNITPPGGNSWEMALSRDQSRQVKGFLETSGERNYRIPYTAITTVRTNTLGNFAKDFFLPTLINYLHRVEGVATIAIATITALFFDILTLPIRGITLIPRILTNANRPENKFHTWLKENRAPDAVLQAEAVRVKHVESTRTRLNRSSSTQVLSYYFIESLSGISGHSSDFHQHSSTSLGEKPQKHS